MKCGMGRWGFYGNRKIGAGRKRAKWLKGIKWRNGKAIAIVQAASDAWTLEKKGSAKTDSGR